MRLPKRDRQEAPVRGQTVDQVSFKDLYRKSEYPVETADGWTLQVTRYQPVPRGNQPLFNEPLMLVPGFSQNRHAWTSGEFVKNLLFFGIDIHILELRGHGKSSIAFQRERAEALHRPLPVDIDYGWDLDSYFLYDLPAGIAAVKAVTGRPKIFFCGHSMGGMLGYGHAGLHDDFEGLITIGAASDLGRGFFFLRLMASMFPAAGVGIDVMLASYNAERKTRHAVRSLFARTASRLKPSFGARWDPGAAPTPVEFQSVPVKGWLMLLEKLLEKAEDQPFYEAAVHRLTWLSNPARVRGSDIRWLLREGSEREPRKVIEQFARWIRRGEFRCYRTGYDFREGFSRIHIPMAIIFGDMDPLASVSSTRGIYRAVRSEYLLWRPVKGNSHIELTMGHDIRQICYDIKNLLEYAVTHRTPAPDS